MFRIAVKGALARKLRLALTAISIVLGVAFVSGTYVLTDTLNATFDRIFGNAEAGVSVVVRGTQTFAPGGENVADERALVPDEVLARVREVPGVASASGSAGGYAQLVYRGRAVSNGAAPNLGRAWTGDVPANPLRLVRGRAPAADGEVVIDERSARTFDIPLGAHAEAIVQGTTVPVTVVGVVKFGKDSTLAGATMAAFVPHQAQQLLLGETGVWSTVQATAEPGVTQTALAARISQALAGEPTVQVMTEKAYVADESKVFKNQLKFFNILLLVFAFIAVFVAVFIIFNTFTVLVAQRTRELALLRALGGSRRQVLMSVVGEAAIVGLASGITGLFGGMLVAAGLRALIQSFGGGLVTVGLQVYPRTVVVSLVVGFVVTVVASIVPAVRASRIPPVAAMRDDFVLPTSSLRRRTRIGVVFLVIGGVLLVTGVKSGTAWQIGLGALGMFRGVVALSPLLSKPIIGGLGRALPRIWGLSGRLARENALRNPRRTAATASALMIGIALTTTMSIMAASITTSAIAQIDRSVGADFIITAKNFAPVPGSFAPSIERLPDIAAVTEFRQGTMEVGCAVTPTGQRAHVGCHQTPVRKQVTGVTSGTVADTLRLRVLAGSLRLAAGEVAVEKASNGTNYLVGSKLNVVFALTGKKTLTVAGVYDTNPIAGSYLIGLPTYDANFRNRLDIVVAVKARSAALLGNARAQLANALRAYPSLELRDQSEFKQNQKRQINQVLSFVLALLVLSIIIAWLGIVNTLALSVFERTREIGLLRAVGMATKQVRRMIRLEAVVIALFGALLGVTLGLGYGAALVQALKSQGITETAFPFTQLVAYLIVGVLAGITAAWWPARRASRLNVLQAISTE